MAHFAVIEENVVTNTIVAETLEIAKNATNKTCIEFEYEAGSVGIGWTYNGKTFDNPTPESIKYVIDEKTNTAIRVIDPSPILGVIASAPKA